MSHIQSLPTELISHIFEYTQHFYDLPRFALVCRSWRDPAQRTIFGSPTLSDERGARAWLDSAVRSRYRVKELTIKDEEIDEELGVDLIEACPGLETLLCRWTSSGVAWCTNMVSSSVKSVTLMTNESFAPDSHPLPHGLRHLAISADQGAGLFYNGSQELATKVLEPILSNLVSIELIFSGNDGVVGFWADLFADVSLPLLRHLRLFEICDWEVWPKLIASLPALESLGTDYDRMSIEAVGASVALSLHALSFQGYSEQEISHGELLRIIKLPNLVGLCQLDFPSSQPSEFAGEFGLELLDECEERSIAFFCCKGYLTRDLMEV